MFNFLKHIRAIILSVVIITTFIKLKKALDQNESEESEWLNITSNKKFTFDVNYNNNYENSNRDFIFNTRKKYKKIIINDKKLASSLDNDSSVFILGLFDLSTKSGILNTGLSEIKAAELAISHINEQHILRGRELKLLVNDTECDPGAAIDRFFHALYSSKKISMLLGSGCSNVTESLANIVPYWNILQISFGSTSPSLSDRNKFPLFFRTVAPDSSFNAAKALFILNYKWNTVAVLSQRENNYLLPVNNLVIQLEELNITCEATVTFSAENFKEQLGYLKHLDLRIIIGSFSPTFATKIFCEAYKLNMYGPEYVWILQDMQEDWWKNKNLCHINFLKESTNGVFIFSEYSEIPENEVAAAGLTNEQFIKQLNSSVSLSKHIKHIYDAIWAMALVLIEVENVYGYNLSQFYYDNDKFVDKLVLKMEELQFIGLTGPIKFNGGDRVGNAIVYQLQSNSINTKLNTVGLYYCDNQHLNLNCKNCSKIKFEANRIPIAKRVLRLKLITVPKIAFYGVLFIAVLGILICFVFLCFNFHYRRLKVVKLSSPKLNSIAVLGCILVYFAVILLGLDMETLKNAQIFSQICIVKVYLLSAGFSLAFGSMFAKTYRVHRIFTYRCSMGLVKDKFLRDELLIALILLLPSLDLLLSIFWSYIDPLDRSLHNLTIETSTDRTILYQPQVEVCRCNNTTGWFLTMYGYKAFLLIMGVYMAWETRHIKVEILNDSQYIGICVYSAFFSSIMVLLSNFLTEYAILAYLARTGSILMSATLTLLLLLVPKLRAVFWNAVEDPIMESMGLKFECNTRRLLVEDPNELTYRLEVQNKVYKCEIEALDREIEWLENTLGENSQLCSQNFLKNSRASWPSTQLNIDHITKNNFRSENVLNDDNMVRSEERTNLFNRFKIILSKFPFQFSSNTVVKSDERINTISGLLDENFPQADVNK